ncbi:hypothetical protein [Granulicella sp. dw_53]|nr:hypothetical protein [Granulicella sp. dw_53]
MIEELDVKKLGEVFDHTLDTNLVYEESISDGDHDHDHTDEDAL